MCGLIYDFKRAILNMYYNLKESEQMRKYKFCKEKLKIISISMLTFGIFFTGSSFAEENPDNLDVRLSEEYLEWSELSNKEKNNSIMPNTYVADASDELLAKYEVKQTPKLVSSLLGKTRAALEDTVSATSTQSRYSLVDDLDMRVEHQGTTSECWAFSLMKAMETNMAITTQSRQLKDFSERHMDYATSKTFLDGTNSLGFNREVGKGGIPLCGLAYLTNGQGAVLEENMPFEDNENKINLSEINKPVDTIVTDYVILPRINKKYERSSSGNTTSVKYYKSSGEEYTQEELESARQMIKEHIVKYGAIATMTGGNLSEYYNNSDIFKASAYNCNVTTKTRDHAITIVGWDDNYSKDNFAEGAKPSTDGAYIVLNTYGTESFDNGYLYVSYEDVFVEDELYGICGTSSINYDTLYQHDFYGGIYQIGSSAQDTGYYATVFEKENTAEEYLQSVGITLADYSKVEIYVNTSGDSLDAENLQLVAAPSTTYSPGYHTINFDEIKVSGTEFAVVVKQISDKGQFYFSVETSLDGTIYANVTSSGLSYYSLDGQKWKELTAVKIDGINLKNSDVCIKAFTTETSNIPEKPDNPVTPTEPDEPVAPIEPDSPVNPDNPVDTVTPEDPDEEEPDKPTTPEDVFKSEIYKIGDEDIMKIEGETTIETFSKNVTTNLEMSFMDNDAKITDTSQIIKTGMKLKLSNDKEYILIVRGDISCDGKLSLIDISKLIMHYNEAKGYELTGNAKKGADMNADGVINLVDVSQMIMVYNLK